MIENLNFVNKIFQPSENFIRDKNIKFLEYLSIGNFMKKSKVIHKYNYEKKIVLIISLILLFSFKLYMLSLSASVNKVYLAEIEMTIDHGARTFVENILSKAESENAPLILRLNTYGGFLDSMDAIIDMLLNAKVPTVAWVAPKGAKAASAGTFIAMAADYIAMADGAVIGSCQPRPEDPKVTNYAAARMRALAEKKYGLNDSRIDLAVKFVTENLDLTTEEALNFKIIDFKANSIDELLEKLGWTGAQVITVEPGFLQKFYSFLNDPTVIGLFFELGFWLILVDIFTPGTQIYGFAGAALILLSLFGIGILGASMTAIALMIVGSALIFVELKYPGIQIFGFAGLVLWVLSIILMYREQPYLVVTIPHYVVIGLLAVGGGFLIFYFHKVRRVLRLRRRMFDIKRLIGMIGVAKTDIKPGKYGVVYVATDNWTAFSDHEIKAGEKVKIVEVVGFKVKVEPVREEE